MNNNKDCKGALFHIFYFNTNISVVDSTFEDNVGNADTVVIGSTNLNIQFKNTLFKMLCLFLVDSFGHFHFCFFQFTI